MLSLRELLRELEVMVVAGEAALDRAVRWVHISELADPTPWLSGGELLLTTGLQLGDDAQQRAYVARLADHGLSGLGFGAGLSYEHVPDALREAAAEHEFPLFEVPYELPFIAITERAFTQLVNEQYAVLRRALSAHERLERIVLSERGLEGVARGLATMIGGPALVFDARGELLARRAGRTGLSRATISALGAELRERTRAGGRRGYVPSAENFPTGALALPVARGPASGRGDGPLPEAWLVAAKDAGPLTELDRLTLHQAVTIVALELLRRRVVDDTERRLAGDVLTALVAGDLTGAELERRLEPFGLRDRAGALVLAPQRGARAAAEESLARGVREEAGGGLVAASGRFLCALLPATGDDELFALAARLHARVERETGQSLQAGAGRAVARGDLRRGFHEARCALEARALAVNGNGDSRSMLATYRDLGSFQLLLSLQDDDALRLFCDSILAPIEDSEGAYGGELMRSLEAFIECNGQWERAAKALFCHRHTLRYRIRRVEELTGRSLDSARDRIDFWLALRGRAGPDRKDDMRVGVPTEIKTDEYRVALTPAGVRELVEHGHEVVIQAGAGEGSAIVDGEYVSQGAKILPDAAAVFGAADMIVKVKEPQAPEVALLEPRHTLFTYLHLAPDPELTRGLVESGATCVAYETVEDARRRLPLLAPMSEVAGKIATQAGAFMLEKPLGGRGILLGGVPGVAAAKVMIIGGGVVGMNAAFIALGMEATVYVYDRSIDRLRELDIAFNGRADTCYASTLDIEQRLPEADLVIGAVLVHGAKAPFVIRREQLALMKRQAVLVDVSIDQGGCFETSRPTTHSDPTYEVDGVLHYCVANMPGAVPVTSTRALTNATMPYIVHVADSGVAQAAKENPGLAKGVNVVDGKVTYAPVAEATGQPYTELFDAFSAAAAR